MMKGAAAMFFVATLVSSLSFLFGAYAHEKCFYPFCRGVSERGLTDWLDADAPGPDAHGVHANWKTIRTGLLEVVVDRVDLPPTGASADSYKETAYGDISPLGTGMVAATGAGTLYFVDENLHPHPVQGRIPFSRDAFDRDTADRHVNQTWFSVKDILVEERGAGFARLFASYHHWNTEQQCFTLRLAMTPLTERNGGYAVGAWETIYEAQPCLPLKERGHTFSGNQAAGRVVSYEEGTVLLSVGDSGFDGIGGEMVIREPGSSHGKMIAIDPTTKAATTVSVGHRNPQGLHVDAEGTVWSTEHGPQGGDELNIIVKGEDYGWPYVTYGTKYGAFEWPLAKAGSDHSGYKRPVFAWVPSIGISELTSVRKPLFQQWRGDLLITSLKTHSLYRTRVREGRVVYVEPIEFPDRIRGITELRDGSIAIKCAGGYIARLRPASIAGALAAAPAN